ncbi:MAG: undecaprenyl-diphosphatase UppP [Candidatus Eremiobacteraeota bacterium]|nr:undecaprenyl-diphosphatase UppP [Candidatus Eremiobacteraeota bacterium]
MNFIEAVILGIVQGLTEFLPISSSAHLLIVPKVAGWDYFGKDFDIALHLGTFIGLVYYYRTQVIDLIDNFVKSLSSLRAIPGDPELRLPWLILISSVPAGFVGFLFGDYIEERFSGIVSIAIFLIVFGIVLGLAEARGRQEKDVENLTIMDAVIVGIFQAAALLPGVSRSGITMTSGLFLGMKKDSAANYSFLISLPVIGGAACYSLFKIISHPQMVSSWPLFITGIAAAALSGYGVIRFLLEYLKTGTFLVFTYYRIVLGILLLVLSFTGVVR